MLHKMYAFNKIKIFNMYTITIVKLLKIKAN